MDNSTTGVLLVNLGTPDAPTTSAVRAFLKQFLSDPRVVDLPRWQWWPILNGIVLTFRPARVARAYQKVWQEQGSPLMVISLEQQRALAARLAQDLGTEVPVALGMTYGTPSLEQGLESLKAQGCDKVVVLPLFPQFSCSTTGAVFDGLAAEFAKLRTIPHTRLIRDYHDHPAYIGALAGSIQKHWNHNGRGQKLLLSFHGVPKRYVDEGDIYQRQCLRTAELVAEHLGLSQGQWMACFQSRFGKEEWLTPYTDETLEALPKQGVTAIDIVTPAFSVDCLETLEEIAIEGKQAFMAAGGKQYQFIPCLNAEPDHIQMMSELVQAEMRNW
ncbi:ferrochelatase [Ferrimonas sediminicola]|uniref:Ferrochelatase n=1 Tax=Ferrimonas sediminicola TaxID=2569538 RepID=A0A4U1BE17_9GAMM|nr:ferrochelatase [Ferrimonas sediminicola]TKB49055.1 ferrochelatase [Ferrimonas sediminicola]